MNKLQQQILSTVVNPAIRQINKSVTGFIRSIDHEHMVANVNYENMHGSGVKVLENVPIRINGGMSCSGPFIGDKIMIEFMQFNPHAPVIVSVIDTNHNTDICDKRMKHSRKGPMVTDKICDRTSWEIGSTTWR